MKTQNLDINSYLSTIELQTQHIQCISLEDFHNVTQTLDKYYQHRIMHIYMPIVFINNDLICEIRAIDVTIDLNWFEAHA